MGLEKFVKFMDIVGDALPYVILSCMAISGFRMYDYYQNKGNERPSELKGALTPQVENCINPDLKGTHYRVDGHTLYLEIDGLPIGEYLKKVEGDREYNLGMMIDKTGNLEDNNLDLKEDVGRSCYGK